MEFISLISLGFIPVLIGFILLYGTFKQVPTYESFVEGGKEGIKIAVQIIPFLVGMLVAISSFPCFGCIGGINEMDSTGYGFNRHSC